ncbi:ATP-dependent sacrificial sulfur transferase LarE [Hespellia stercorisuis]|uniref:tRNA(Ile)-lysidine/2-thiocytidine synthase N-terminal domain-containing protein n=1 Tax=Hespellia stercorisuis DSM 15480 TaxID=1121950 RepID=A0A1M6NJ73_9FIRM|nr:ATP-dependent sacrificial sulfur transferase LarE [Hespellia stercorisuis]SHJ95696.1 uncharacterized protein SAMN02745243_01831 [Hespellia stercorisuis DSM 15480]
MNTYEEKCKELKEMIDGYTKKNLMIAFSGGVDSSLLLSLACESAKQYGTTVYAATLHTMLHPMNDLEEARRTAREAGAEHLVLKVNELQDAGILHNPVDRCYRCKKCLFQQVQKQAEELEIDVILDGTNEDDLHVYRPGIRALGELGIISPLALTGMTKAEVRRLAKENGLATSSKPSTPCLATRFPYGTQLEESKMKQVEKGEAYLKTLGFYNVRLRVHGDTARIEVDRPDIGKMAEKSGEIVAYLKSLGYRYITVDLEGFRSGSMDLEEWREQR